MIPTDQMIDELKAIMEKGFEVFVKGDLAAIESIYSEDASLAIGQDLIKGRSNLMGFYQQFFTGFDLVENYPISMDFLVINEGAATITAHEKMVLKSKVDDFEDVDTELMVTFVFRKEGDQWKCCYEQASLHQGLF